MYFTFVLVHICSVCALLLANSLEIHTKIEVEHAVGHQHIVQQGQSWVVVPREERIVSVRPADVSLCHNRTQSSWISMPLEQAADSMNRSSVLSQIAGLTYQASVSFEEGVPHLLLFTDWLPLHLHSEVLVPADTERRFRGWLHFNCSSWTF